MTVSKWIRVKKLPTSSGGSSIPSENEISRSIKINEKVTKIYSKLYPIKGDNKGFINFSPSTARATEKKTGRKANTEVARREILSWQHLIRASPACISSWFFFDKWLLVRTYKRVFMDTTSGVFLKVSWHFFC